NSIDRAGLLAEAALDALHHIDIIAGCAPRTVVAPGSRFDGDRLRRANRLAQLAGDAALLTVGIAAQRMLATEAGRHRALLEGVVQCFLRREEVAHRQEERRDELLEEERTEDLSERCHFCQPIRAKPLPS